VGKNKSYLRHVFLAMSCAKNY